MSEQVVAAPAASQAPTQPQAESKEIQASAQTENEEIETAEEEEAEEVKADASKSDKKEVKAQKELEKRIKKLKLKVDGKEIEEELDLDNDEELVKQLQLAKMGQKRAQEKALLEKELASFFKELQENPFNVLAREMGMDPNQLIEKYINEQLEQAAKSPEQVERERIEAELKALKDEREREKKESEARELERLQQQEFERYDMLMDQALTKSDLPKSPYVVKKIADYMLVALQSGYEVTPEDVIPLVREEMQQDVSEMFQALPEDVIEQLLGDGVLNKLRKRRIAKAKEAQTAVAKPVVNDTGKSSKSEENAKSKEKVSFKQFFGV